MNAVQDLIDAGTFFFLCAVIIGVYVGPLRNARIAKWRQELFAVRNTLWDEMRKAGTLDAPAHRKLRDLINYSIRYTPVMNILYLGAVFAFTPTRRPSKEPKFADLLKQVRNPQANAALDEAMRKFAVLFINQLFFATFPGALIGWPALAVVRVLRTARWVNRCKNDASGWVRNSAERFGELAAKPTLANAA